jgi:hypothetical protein
VTFWRDASAVTTACVAVVTATGAYLRFFRGRIFRLRVEIEIDGGIVTLGSSRAAQIQVTVRNSGQAKFVILSTDQDPNFVQVHDLSQGELEVGAEGKSISWDNNDSYDEYFFGQFRDPEVSYDRTLESGEYESYPLLIPLRPDSRLPCKRIRRNQP